MRMTKCNTSGNLTYRLCLNLATGVTGREVRLVLGTHWAVGHTSTVTCHVTKVTVNTKQALIKHRKAAIENVNACTSYERRSKIETEFFDRRDKWL